MIFLGLPTWAVWVAVHLHVLQSQAVCLAHRKHYKKKKKIVIILTIIFMFWLAKANHSGLSLTFSGPGARGQTEAHTPSV